MISAIITGISIGFLVVLCVFLMVECWSLKMDLDNEKCHREINEKILEQYRKNYLESYEDARQWEKKYNRLLKNFQKYIDEHGNKKHHQRNCYSSTVKGITDEQLEQIIQELREYWEENIYQKNPPVNHDILPKAEKEQLEKWKNGEIKLSLDFDDERQHWTSNNKRNTYKRW